MKDAIKPYSMILSKQSDTAKNQFALNKNVNTYIYICISTTVYIYQFSPERGARCRPSLRKWIAKLVGCQNCNQTHFWSKEFL